MNIRLSVAAAAFLSLGSITTAFAQGSGQPPMNSRAELQLDALQREKAARTPTQNKIDSQLLFARSEKRNGLAHRDAPLLRHNVELEPDSRTKVDIDATVSDDLLAAIAAAGGEILDSIPEESAVRALVPIDSMEALAAREDVEFIRPAAVAIMNTGSVDSQGDLTHRAVTARAATGATGAGVVVGVLSDSLDDNKNSLRSALNSGDLDGNNSFVLPKQRGRGEGEGLAMMEIVHDLAPAAQLVFATGSSGEARMAANIRALAHAGCRVIIDDITYTDESPFQDGKIAQAVSDVSDRGVLYFSSAANSGNIRDRTSGTWEGNFVGGQSNRHGQLHLFKRGVPADRLTRESGRPAVLFWSDPLHKSSNDYDLVVYDRFGNIVSISNNTQNGRQDPIEIVRPPNAGQYLAIYKYSGARRFLHLETSRGQLAIATGGSTRGHNASGAENAFCVAAAPAGVGITGGPRGPFPNAFTAANKAEPFSSDGFRHIFFRANGTPYTPGDFLARGGRVLKKPDITAADGVSTTLPGNSGLNPFFGTSAAAPHAGAIAALVLSHRPHANPSQVRKALYASAVNVMGHGFDNVSGHGIVMAPGAVNAVDAVITAEEMVPESAAPGEENFFAPDDPATAELEPIDQ